MRRTVAAICAAIGAAATITLTAGCGASQPVTYAPAAYGVPGHCYYVNSPAEAVALRNSGLCPRSWVPTPMPLWWEEEYYGYYDSPAYYGTYVPVRYRTVYVRHVTTFGRANRARIATLSRSATYRSSSGGTVKGTSITGKTRFGSGTSFGSSGQQYGGGSARQRGTTGGTSRTRSVTGHTGTARTTHVSFRH